MSDTDSARAARADLAFMRELAEDRGPLPWQLGAHMIAVGGTFGLNLIYTWAGLRGFVPWPEGEWNTWAWAPATVVYLPLVVWLTWRGKREPQGPASRAFAAAWSGVGAMTAVVLGSLIIATYTTGENHFRVWPSLAMALYGGAWMAFSIAQRRHWGIGVAIGCFATALACSALIGTPEHWLAIGLGSLLFMAAPGIAMLRGRRR
jgi:hypothetical protein